MIPNQTNSFIGDFVVRYFKTIVTCIVFLFGFYCQYQMSMMKIDRMEEEIAQIKVQMDAHFVKLDNMKLDKVVFEATMKQFSDMSTDIRQIRDRLEDVLSDHERHASR